MPPIDEATLLDEVLRAPERALVPLPDTQRIERPGWFQLTTPSLTRGGLNEVAHAVLTEAEADEVIDRTIAHYRAIGLHFRWSVTPDSAPADLAERLRARGLVESWTCGMARDTTPLVARPRGEGDGDEDPVEVHEVGAALVDELTAVMAEGWGMDPAALAPLHTQILGAHAQGQRLYLARRHGRGAGTAGAALLERSVYLIGGVVLPQHRQRGVYSALVDARLAAARAHGLALATVQARADSAAPLLEHLGFRTVCRFPMYYLRD